jgi:hypothetical protein
MDGKKRNVYTDICKRYCENPDEKMGESLLKILWKKPLYVPLKKLLTFSFVNNIFGSEHYNNYSSSDWLILLNIDNEIESYSVNQLYISRRRKDIDIPLPYDDQEKLQTFINKKRENSFNNYQQNELKNFNLYYNMLKKKDNEIINQIAFNIKESLIKGNMLIISPKYFQIQNINQLVYLLKYLNLNYSPFQLFEIYPELNFAPLNYDPNSEFLKSEFSLSKKNYDEIEGNENIRIPRAKNLFKSDLSELDYKYTIFDSGLKKLGMFMHKSKKKEKAIFELIDEKKEEIVNSNQFTQGCKNIGLLGPNYLNNDELKELFKVMDINSNNVVTLDDFLNFLKKYDIQSILTNIKNEMSSKSKNGYINSSEAEKFMMLSFDKKIKIIQEKIEEIKKFYGDVKEIKDEDIQKVLEPITNVIFKKDITNYFKLGIIFLDEFSKFINSHEIEMEENIIEDIFAYFDKKNKNYFIFVRDIIDLFKGNENDTNNKEELTGTNNINTIDQNKSKTKPEESKVVGYKLSNDKYLLIWIGIIKKLIKFCLVNLGIEPNEFSEKFIFVKESRVPIVNLNFIQTNLIIDKLNQRITNFLPIEKRILFDFYLDYYKYGIIFKENLKPLFDNIMEYIQNQFLDIKDFDFNSFDSINGNKYISASTKNLKTNLSKLEEKYLEILDLHSMHPQIYMIWISKTNLNRASFQLDATKMESLMTPILWKASRVCSK